MPPAVNVQNLHKKYGPNEVIRDLNLSAMSGDVLTRIGSSGSGKSTLLRCINLLETPDEGGVEIHGELVLIRKESRGAMSLSTENRCHPSGRA